MDRCAVFVDAGYLLAEAGDLFFGTKSRSELNCAYPKLLSELERLACDHSQLPILRIYWYDGAYNGIPDDEQESIARLPNVKVHLGRIVGGEQKGVDALIYRDLMTLARERALATGYLLSGDEDLREGVIAAQDMGVRIILLGVPSNRIGNQSDFLIQEADEHIILEKNILDSCFSKAPNLRPKEPVSRSKDPKKISQAKKFGREFAEAWVKSATDEQIHELHIQFQSHHRQIPSKIDRELIQRAEQTLGSLRSEDTIRNSLREGFWDSRLFRNSDLF